MEKFDLEELAKRVNESFLSQTISGRALLDRLAVIDENSRKTAAYADHKYAPFYYCLGKELKAESIMELGFSLGLLSSSYLFSNKFAKYFFGFREISNHYFSMRIGKSNIDKRFKGESNFYVGNLFDQDFLKIRNSRKWDLVFVNEELSYDKHLEYFDIAWDSMSENALLIIEHIGRHNPAKEAFVNFCSSKNRNFITFDTRYKTGIVQK